MNLDSLTKWITLAANIGVIFGLVFVGVQLQQDRELATIDGIQSTADLRMSSSQLIIENADIWVRGLADETLIEEESVIFDLLVEAHQTFYFSNYNRNSRIGSPENRDRWVREAALDIVTYPGIMKWWKRTLDRRVITDPDGAIYYSLINDEINRLEEIKN